MVEQSESTKCVSYSVSIRRRTHLARGITAGRTINGTSVSLVLVQLVTMAADVTLARCAKLDAVVLSPFRPFVHASAGV